MKLQQIKNAVEAIRECKWDDESAHGSEDTLHEQVLTAIGGGLLEDCTPAEAAREAMETVKISFSRWCA